MKRFHVRSCTQYRNIFVRISIDMIDPATLKLSVITQAIINVSVEATTRQVSVFIIDLDRGSWRPCPSDLKKIDQHHSAAFLPVTRRGEV